MTYTIPPARNYGDPDPVLDHNAIVGALQVIEKLNVLDTRWAGGADPAGTADSTAAIQAAANAGVADIPPGTYKVTSPVTLPANCGVRGDSAGLLEKMGTIIKPAAGFSGAAVFTFAHSSQSQEIRNLCIDGSAMAAGTADGVGGITVSHDVLSVKLENLYISGAGINNGIGNVNAGTTWRGRRVMVHGVNGHGFHVENAPDSTWTDCLSLGAGGNGWMIFGASNAVFTNCRAEWSGGNGFYLTGAWGTGNGSGMVHFLGCSTDRNTGNGVMVDATGTAPVTFSGLMTRRDGNGTGTAGVSIASGSTIIPVQIAGWQCFPGVNDDGTGTLTPQYALNVAGAVQYLSVSDAFLHAATTATNGMTAGNNARWRCVATRTGPTATPGTITLAADST